MSYAQTPEGQVMEAVCHYLTLRRRYFFRINNGGIYDPVKQIFRKPSKWTIKGVADIQVLKNGRCIFLEFKRPDKNGVLSKEQIEFGKNVEAQGFEYYVVRSIDDVREIGL